MGTHLFNRHTTWTVFVSLLVALGLGACSDVSNAPAPPTPLSPDAKLGSLTVSPGTLQPPFSSDTINYTVDVATDISNVTVMAQVKNAGATLKINGSSTTSLSVPLVDAGTTGSSTLVTIVVTAQDLSQNTYVVTVRRAAPAGNNNLQSLTVSTGSLSPAFNASVLNYTVGVATNITSVVVTAQAQDAVAGATVSINGLTTTSQSVTLNGPGTGTLVTIVVTAPNLTQKTYLVTVNQAAPGGNNNLQSLTVSNGSLSPGFDASILNYIVSVATNITSVVVTAQAQDAVAGATVSINGLTTTSRSVTLNGPGTGTLVTIVVTAPNLTQKTYLVTVNQAAPGGNNNLQSLTVSSGTLTPAFVAPGASGSPGYTVDVASTVNSITVTAQAQDAGATVSINGLTTTSRSVTLNGPGTGTLVTIVVTAPNLTQKTYLVTVNQAAIASNAGLSSLTVSTGTLAPSFAPPGVSGLPGYTVVVPNATTSITVTAVQADPNATLTISPSATVNNLQVGNTAFTIEVTAPSGNQKIYFVTVTRAAPVSNNANLFSLEVYAGSVVTPPALNLTPLFVQATASYTTAEVANTVSQVTIVATKADPNATMTIGGNPSTGQTTVNIGAAGSATQILIIVTPPSGSADAITYTVNVPKAT